MTGILLKDFSEYNLMDDDSIAGLKAKLNAVNLRKSLQNI
jgi:hypothetical protein